MMASRKNSGDSTSNTPKQSQFFRPSSKNEPIEAGFAVMAVELPPGLPKVNDLVNNDMCPPAHIPYSGRNNKQKTPNGQKKGGKSGGSSTSPNGRRGSPSQQHHQKKEANSRGGGEGTSVKRGAHSPTSLTSSNPNLQPFQLVSPLPFAGNTVPIRGIKNENGTVKYPLLLCSQEGTLMLSMAAGVVVELCVDRGFRVVCNSDFMAYVNSTGSVSSILHKYAKIVHGKEHVHCKFAHTNDRMAVLGPEGILFSMDSLSEAYLLSGAAENGPSAIALEKPTFPIQNMDYSIQQMYAESDIGAQHMERCQQIMNKAMYEKKSDGTIIVHINGMILKSNADSGDVSIEAKPIKLSINSHTLTAQLRSTHIDMAIQDKDKCYVKRADKRIHASRSGMVVSDGTCTISMDQCGRILSCS